MSSLFALDLLSCSEIIGDLDLAGLEVFFYCISKRFFRISVQSKKFLYGLWPGYAFFSFNLDDFRFSFDFRAIP